MGVIALAGSALHDQFCLVSDVEKSGVEAGTGQQGTALSASTPVLSISWVIGAAIQDIGRQNKRATHNGEPSITH